VGTSKALRWFKQNRVSMAVDLNRLPSIFDRLRIENPPPGASNAPAHAKAIGASRPVISYKSVNE